MAVQEGYSKVSYVLKDNAYVLASETGTVTSRFGDIDAIRNNLPHVGVDFACPVGTEIHAPVDGVVIAVKDYGDRSMGEAVFVKMSDGKQYVVGHLSEPKVAVGDKIQTGELLGLSGNTGRSSGPHLHFGAYDAKGNPIDPGNISWDAFQEKVVAFSSGVGRTLPPKNIPKPNDPIGEAGTWMGDKMEDGARIILEPVGDAIGGAMHATFLGFMHALPGVLVVGGMVCFVLTIAISHYKPYFFGLGMWGLSAVVRGINIESGI